MTITPLTEAERRAQNEQIFLAAIRAWFKAQEMKASVDR